MNFKIFKNLKISIVHDYVLLLKQKKKKINSEYLEQESVLK